MRQIFKNEIKFLTKEIRELKSKVKLTQKDGGCAASDQSTLHSLSVKSRHVFIAYAVFRSKPVDMVENNSKTEFSQRKVDKIIEEVKKRAAEVRI